MRRRALYAWCYGGGGIAGYNIGLTDIADATSYGPVGFEFGVGMRGFTIGNADLAGPGALSAWQDTNVPTSLIHNIGIAAGTIPFIGGTEKNIPWLQPVLLAFGDWNNSGDEPWFNENDSNVNVFDTDVSETTHEAVPVFVPEPATMGLLAVGVLGLLRRRRS